MNLIHGYTGHLLSTSTSVKDPTLTGVLVKTDEEIQQWGPHDLSILRCVHVFNRAVTR